jgi:hypothetical protein
MTARSINPAKNINANKFYIMLLSISFDPTAVSIFPEKAILIFSTNLRMNYAFMLKKSSK